MNIRKAAPGDANAIAAIIVPIIREGTTYALDPDMSEPEALAYWMGRDKETFVARNKMARFSAFTACGQIKPVAGGTSATAAT
jgi:hypothetical protein